MKKINSLLVLGIVAALSAGIGRADTITETGFLPDPPNTNSSGSPVVINLNNFNAWGYYANAPANLAPTTDASDLGQFSNFTSGAVTVTGGFIYVGYTGGVGGTSPSSQASTNTHDNMPGTFSITTKLFAPEESLSFYLLSFDTTENINATLGSATFSLTNVPLPLLTVPNGSLTDGSSNRQGTLILDVTGNIGDTLTFTGTPNETGVSNPINGNISLIAVGADEISEPLAAPEPTIWAMMLGGLAALGFCVRRQRARR